MPSIIEQNEMSARPKIDRQETSPSPAVPTDEWSSTIDTPFRIEKQGLPAPSIAPPTTKEKGDETTGPLVPGLETSPPAETQVRESWPYSKMPYSRTSEHEKRLPDKAPGGSTSYMAQRENMSPSPATPPSRSNFLSFTP
ncbi:hypothetical protein RRF57_009519 [Xylaria bambusicola]|uniref:Uncharacterized protein n=1 Tax=Xylaria bambusicola TaxID=326684 RepID=A0AAN7UJS0_9PEZI